MENKFLFAGCSYFSGNPSVSSAFTDISLNNNDKYWIQGCAAPGQSNVTILKRIYDTVNDLSFNGATIFCQLTHPHRIGFYHDCTNCWIDYQPNFFNPIPEKSDTSVLTMDYIIDYKENKLQTFGDNTIFSSEFERDKLRKWYETYLTYIHNDWETFKFLMYQVDLLKSYLEQKKCEVFFLYWPLINDEKEILELKRRNFISLDDDYSILSYTTKNNLINKNDSHLSSDGVKFIAQKLYDLTKK